jgi:predicted nuclease of restriction endonuclease-like (RecB) superfamily
LKSTRKYQSWLAEIKENIRQAQLRASLQVNVEMLMLYWYIGKQIEQKAEQNNWGAKIIPQLSLDLRTAFPQLKGFSERNLLYMRQFAKAYPEFLITQQPVAQLEKKKSKATAKAIAQEPLAQLGIIDKHSFMQHDAASVTWSHHVVLLNKTKDEAERSWYIKQCTFNGWSSTVLAHQIESDLYARQKLVKKANNFKSTLPLKQSELAEEILKDPYKFDFLNISTQVTEHELKDSLLQHLTKFLIELGAGFAFVGKEYHVKAGRKDYYLDLLFYHLHLRSYIVIEIKMEDFQFAHAGQLHGYLNIVNDKLKADADNPTIGILLCKGKDNVEVDYALAGLKHPIGVSEYKMLPQKIRQQLPTAKQLETALRKADKAINNKRRK